MIYKFWKNADYLNSMNNVILTSGNIDEIQYSGYKQGWSHYAFSKGKKIDTSLFSELKFYYDSTNGDIFTEILQNVYSLLIVSKKVKQLFDEQNIEYLQYIPIEIKEMNTGVVHNDYYVVNFLKKIDGINLERSQYDYLEEYDIYTFWGNHICFYKDKVQNIDVFLDDKASFTIFVSEKIRKIFKENNWQEMNFTPMDVV